MATFEMSNEEWRLFRVILKIMEFEYEVSEIGDRVHITVHCSEQDSVALEATHQTMVAGLQLQERSKKPC